jgi:hypothetical protein
MSVFAHHPRPAKAVVDPHELALVQPRYVALPALLWAAATLAALLVHASQPPADTAAPVWLSETSLHGA